MKRLLITGGSGYLGARLMDEAARLGWDTHGTFFSQPFKHAAGAAHGLDLTDGNEVDALVARLRPEAIVHTACSNRDAGNQAAIVPAAQAVAGAASRHGAHLVHVSTDQVFDGEHGPFDDEAPHAPVGEYGRAKAAAETVVATGCPTAAIARPSLIWSLRPLDRQTKWLQEGVRNGTRVTLFTDEIRCPVHLDDLAGALLELAARPELSGPFNMGGAQALTRWEFGLKLLEALGMTRPGHVVPGTVAESGLARARDLTLSGRRTQTLLSTRLRGVDEIAARPRSRQPRYCEG